MRHRLSFDLLRAETRWPPGSERDARAGRAAGVRTSRPLTLAFARERRELRGNMPELSPARWRPLAHLRFRAVAGKSVNLRGAVDGPIFHGKEGVPGSSPGEGFANYLLTGTFSGSKQSQQPRVGPKWHVVARQPCRPQSKAPASHPRLDRRTTGSCGLHERDPSRPTPAIGTGPHGSYGAG
jgi:hypothetical protein